MRSLDCRDWPIRDWLILIGRRCRIRLLVLLIRWVCTTSDVAWVYALRCNNWYTERTRRTWYRSASYTLRYYIMLILWLDWCRICLVCMRFVLRAKTHVRHIKWLVLPLLLCLYCVVDFGLVQECVYSVIIACLISRWSISWYWSFFLSGAATFTNNLSLFVLIQNNDGEIDAEDLKTYWTKLKRILTKNMPDATGFSLGFFYGLTN